MAYPESVDGHTVHERAIISQNVRNTNWRKCGAGCRGR